MVKSKIQSQYLAKMSRYLGLTPFVIWLVITPSPAYAYIDPGSGSMFIQLAIAAIAGGLFTLKIYWQRLKNLLGFGPKPEELDSENTDDKN